MIGNLINSIREWKLNMMPTKLFLIKSRTSLINRILVRMSGIKFIIILVVVKSLISRKTKNSKVLINLIKILSLDMPTRMHNSYPSKLERKLKHLNK